MISVIIAVYNTRNYLEKCVESILNQTYKELEIILVNDGSSDDSLSLMLELQKKDSRIFVIDRPHEGVSAARNAGITAASGEYISFIDSDDWIDTDTYQSILTILKENEADAAYFEWTLEYSDGTFTTKGHSGKRKVIIEGNECIKSFFENDISLRLSSGILNTSLLDGVFFEEGRERGEDMLVSFLAITKARRIVYVDIPFYHRYYRNGSLSNKSHFARNDIGRATCTDIMIDYIQQKEPELIQSAYVYSFNFYMVVLNHIMYYRCEKENSDIYDLINDRLVELWRLIESPMKNLPKNLSWAYKVFLKNKTIYHFIMVIYYRYVKKELNGKRQR